MAKPINWISNLLFIWLAEIFSRIGSSIALPFVILYMRDRYLLSNGNSSFIMFGLAGSLALFFSFPLWGMIGDRFGRRLMLLRAIFCSVILYASFMFAPTVGILIILRFVIGFFSGTISPAQALVVSTTPEKHHGLALGILSSSVWIGSVLGPLLGMLVVKYCRYNDFLDRLLHLSKESIFARCWSYNVAFSMAILFFFIAGFITLFLVRENFVPPVSKQKIAVSSSKSFGKMFVVFTILGMFLWMSFARRCDESYISPMVEVVSGLKGALHIMHIMSCGAFLGALISIISAILIGASSDLLLPHRVIIPIVIMASFAKLGQAFAPNLLVLVVVFVISFVVNGLEPAVLALLSRESPPERYGTIFGVAASLRILGLMIGTWFGRGVMKICDSCLSDGIKVCGIAIDSRGIGIRSVFLLGAVTLFLMIPWVFFVERMVAKRHQQLEEEGR